MPRPVWLLRSELAPGCGQGPLCFISHPRRRGLDPIPILQIRKLRQSLSQASLPRFKGSSYQIQIHSRLDSVFRLGSLSLYPQQLSDTPELTSPDSIQMPPGYVCSPWQPSLSVKF